MGELSSKTPDQILDVLGRACPYPLFLAKQAVEKLKTGQTLKVICDAPGSAEGSIPKWIEKKGYKFESVKKEDEGIWELYIQKT
ncbi:MAG: sulfurtransferase TusA family protein [Nitrospiraceae bacterium]|nr:sulfurtransferase TusA family protein [Nitrospiraceae bacterium]